MEPIKKTEALNFLASLEEEIIEAHENNEIHIGDFFRKQKGLRNVKEVIQSLYSDLDYMSVNASPMAEGLKKKYQ